MPEWVYCLFVALESCCHAKNHLREYGMRYEWDRTKAQQNEIKHGVTFQEAMSAFDDPLSEEFDDPDHSAQETRVILIGQSGLGRLLVVSFVEGADMIRIITARTATRKEQKEYEA